MDINVLFKLPLFKNIPAPDREEFIANSNLRTKSYPKGAYIARQRDTVDALYFLIQGSVKTEMISESGSVLSMENIVAPNSLAPAFLFAENHHFPVDVIALEKCEVVTFPKQAVIKLLSSSEPFLLGYMALISNRASFLSQRLKLLSIKTIKGKLSQYILERTRDKHFVLPMNQTELAEYFGVARPSLARSLSEMVAEGIIRLERRKGEVLNLNALKELIIQ
ncbi:MAG: Crp/Fnr family transcriptional regulator [Bacteroides sp.]|nr:Crp/Fnr family transcriptional regulator [Bacteroides sp.]